MAFGQASGPPATHSQLRALTELLQAAGHGDFRDARGPMGFTQRQAGGKFTVDEAAEFIDQLQTAEYEASKSAAPEKRPTAKTTTKAKVGAPSASLGEAERALRTASTKSLVLEVRRRGWIVTKPE